MPIGTQPEFRDVCHHHPQVFGDIPGASVFGEPAADPGARLISDIRHEISYS